jgi:hypothetical protein
MASIHRQMKLAFVFPDGEAGFVLKSSLPDGEVVELQLDAVRAVRLAYELLGAAKQLLPKGQK